MSNDGWEDVAAPKASSSAAPAPPTTSSGWQDVSVPKSPAQPSGDLGDRVNQVTEGLLGGLQDVGTGAVKSLFTGNNLKDSIQHEQDVTEAGYKRLGPIEGTALRVGGGLIPFVIPGLGELWGSANEARIAAQVAKTAFSAGKSAEEVAAAVKAVAPSIVSKAAPAVERTAMSAPEVAAQVSKATPAVAEAAPSRVEQLVSALKPFGATVAKSAAIGGGEGAMSGLGHSLGTKSVGDTVNDTLTGGAKGAAIGTALPVGAKVLGGLNDVLAGIGTGVGAKNLRNMREAYTTGDTSYVPPANANKLMPDNFLGKILDNKVGHYLGPAGMVGAALNPATLPIAAKTLGAAAIASPVLSPKVASLIQQIYGRGARGLRAVGINQPAAAGVIANQNGRNPNDGR